MRVALLPQRLYEMQGFVLNVSVKKKNSLSIKTKSI